MTSLHMSGHCYDDRLWRTLHGEQSQLASVSVPLLIHCLTLPTGPDVFWKLVEHEFSQDDWRHRFAAVERVTVLARILKPDTIRMNQQVMTSLSHAFCCLIGSLNDINSRVVQRTTIYLETIKTCALKVSIFCFDAKVHFYFDIVTTGQIEATLG